MFKKIIITTLFLIFTSGTYAFDIRSTAPCNDFENNPYITPEEKAIIAPYLMPDDHPVKLKLDCIFCAKRATLNKQSFEDAGFTIKFSQPRSFIKVASHPHLPGYLIKAYLDSESRLKKKTEGWIWLTRRVAGVNKIHEYIQNNKVEFFVAPKKWIYALPPKPSSSKKPNYTRKNIILVVEDMKLVSERDNEKAWKTIITKKHLDEFYDIITYAGGSSYRAGNVAYTKNGKFAFIDTEYSYMTKPSYSFITKYLSPEMAAYWKKKTGEH